MTVIGWDIGGVNTKIAVVRDGTVGHVRSRAFELQRDPGGLVPLLQELARDVGPARHAVTMTAELSQMFRAKRDGVAFVLDAVAAAFPLAVVRVFGVDGRFRSPADARRDPLMIAAANWAATARSVSRRSATTLLVDIGTTTTDLIPIVDGRVAALGRTDPERLQSRELVYTGSVRTPVEAIVSEVPYRQGQATVSSEAFALAADVHVWRGHLDPEDYSCPTPDGRPTGRLWCGERLARVICADRDTAAESDVDRIAEAAARAQVARISDAMRIVLARHPEIATATVTGVGAFIGETAAVASGLRVTRLADALGADAARCAPAAAVAELLAADEHTGASPGTHTAEPRSVTSGERAVGAAVDVVLKIGGGLLAQPEDLDAVLRQAAALAESSRLLIVPGGGPFADAVRSVDRRLALPAETTHWMAVLAMDQYAHLVAARLGTARVVHDPSHVVAACDAGCIPVLAPSRWLQREDPLPHSWDVTSDSLALWCAAALGAPRIVLIKPRGATGDVVDGYFALAQLAAPAVDVQIVTADVFAAPSAAISR